MNKVSTPDSLQPGDLVGPWRIEGYAGRGSYGAVYRARRAGHPSSGPVALKVAMFSNDPRFAREVGLLTRVDHPSVPRLLDRGWWHSAEGVAHPYVVMEWIRGRPLYDWAREANPSSRQVLQVLAQLAWALEVVHRAEGLHRDVRGDNILVEPEGRAVLVDFGSCTWAAQANTVTKERSGRGRRVLLATLLALGLGATWWMAPDSGKAESEMLILQEPVLAVAPEEENTGLGDGGVTTRAAPHDTPRSSEVIALEVPKQPLPSQRRAPCKRRAEVEINGGCWAQWANLTPPCGDEVYEWNGACYIPLFADGRTRVPTTDKFHK